MATPIPPVDPNRSIFGEDFSNGLETADFRDRALSRDHIEECRDARVTCVRHCKDPAGVEHEALEFQIEVPDSDAANPSRTVYLFVDRVGGSPAPSRTSSSSSLQPSNSSKETITSSGNLSSSYPAVDRLILACYTKSRFETVATLTIPKHVQFSVVNAIALIVAMSQSNIIYNIQSANCYWYAGGISAAIAGRYDLKSEVGNSKMKSGHFGSLKVNDPSRISQEKLLEAWIEHENAYAKLLSLREMIEKAREEAWEEAREEAEVQIQVIGSELEAAREKNRMAEEQLANITARLADLEKSAKPLPARFSSSSS